jgi:hypothetical protein
LHGGITRHRNIGDAAIAWGLYPLRREYCANGTDRPASATGRFPNSAIADMAADMAKPTRLTRSGSRLAKFAALR